MEFTEFKNRIKTYLCPPGNGVYTVNTAKEKKELFQKSLYQNGDIQDAWEKTLDDIQSNTKPLILGVCSDSGGGIQRGANWGPLFIRESYIKTADPQDFFDIGDIRVIPHLLHDKYLNQETLRKCRASLYKDASSDLPVSPLSITSDFLEIFYSLFPEQKILALGGDHSVSFSLVGEYLKAKKNQNKKTAVIHFDAHTDLLEERLGIDICFGSWVPQILPLLESPSHLLQFGIRSTGFSKSHWENTFGVKQYWAAEIKKMGPEKIAKNALEYLKREKIDELYISYDIDALDSQYASATGTPEDGGLSPYETLLIIDILKETIPITGADLVEVAPMVNTRNTQKQLEPDVTLMSATSIVDRLLEAMQ